MPGGRRRVSVWLMSLRTVKSRWLLLVLVVGCVVGLMAVVVYASGVRSRVRGGSTSVARCFEQLVPAVSKPSTGAAGGATAGLGLFRRAGVEADLLPVTDKPLGQELRPELRSYDPALIRRISATPPTSVIGGESTYVVVGQGAAPNMAIQSVPCVRRLSSHARRQLQAALRYIRAVTPSGPAFCLIGVAPRDGQKPRHLSLRGGCETFADAATGFGAIEADVAGGPFLQGLVPDGVSTVYLRYRRHVLIRAHVSENAFSARVPRLPPLARGPNPARPGRVRHAVLDGLPTQVVWLGPDGRTVRVFSPPPAYVHRLTLRYQACRAMDCGR